MVRRLPADFADLGSMLKAEPPGTAETRRGNVVTSKCNLQYG
jgi:hypothetical protein